MLVKVKMYIPNHRELNSKSVKYNSNRVVLDLTYCQNYAFSTALSVKLIQTSLYF